MDTPDSVCRASLCRARPLLGTFVEIRSAGASPGAVEQAVDAAFAAVAEVHRLMSFHDADSDVSRLNRQAFNHSVAVDPWTYEVLETALALHRQSMGAFDIAVAPALQELGMLPLNEGERDIGRIARATSGAIELLPDNRVRFHHPATRIDLGGIAKGFAVDRALDVLREQNQSQGLVNAGGDLATFGSFPETVALRNTRSAQVDRQHCHRQRSAGIIGASVQSVRNRRRSGFGGHRSRDPGADNRDCRSIGAGIVLRHRRRPDEGRHDRR
jgi:thiamine biosynthesis lipoprotein